MENSTQYYTRIRDIDFKENIDSNVEILAVGLLYKYEVKQGKYGAYINACVKDGDKKFDLKSWNFLDKNKEYWDDCLGHVVDLRIRVKKWDASATGYTLEMETPWLDKTGMYSEMDFKSVAENYKEAWDYIAVVLSQIERTTYGQIAKRLIEKNYKVFNDVAGGVSKHHEVHAGLLVHTYGVLRAALSMYKMYKEIYGERLINYYLLASACIVHDIGKCRELEMKETDEIAYTNESVLASHIMFGIMEVSVAATELGYSIDDPQVQELIHCIGAHHGKLEYGSPVTPAIPEAMILHYADEVDAKMWMFNRELKELNEKDITVKWNSRAEREAYYKGSGWQESLNVFSDKEEITRQLDDDTEEQGEGV